MAKVLIIDDDKISRFALSTIIKYEGFEVDEAENGIKGLALAKTHQYDIIFCDIHMPEMDGIELVQRLKELDIYAPIIMVSAYSEIANVVKVIKKGAFDFISKPIDINRFIVTLQNAIKYAKLTKEINSLKAKIQEVNEMSEQSDSSIATVKKILNN